MVDPGAANIGWGEVMRVREHSWCLRPLNGAGSGFVNETLRLHLKAMSNETGVISI